MCAFRPLLKNHIVNTVGHTKLVPGLTRWLDLPDVAAMAIPARLLVINGRQDTRCYAKEVRGGGSVHNLSGEEEQAIREAFVSPTGLAVPLKFAMAAALFVLLGSYLFWKRGAAPTIGSAA